MNDKKRDIKILLVLVVIALLLSTFFASTKKTSYADDFWSMEIAQGSFDFISDKYIEKWNTPKTINEKISIEGDEKFNFSKVIKATEKDNVHPPFYYLLLNFLGSLFNNVSLPLIAKIFNILVNAGIIVMFFLVFRRLYYKPDLEEKYNLIYFLPSVFWIVSYASNETFMLFRMYLLLVFLSLCLIYIFLLLINNNNDKDYHNPDKFFDENHKVIDIDISKKISNLIAFFIVCVIGILTHLYFLFLLIMFLFIVSITFLLRRKYLMTLKVLLISGASLGIDLLIFPKYFNVLTSSFHAEGAYLYFLSSGEKLEFSNFGNVIKTLCLNFFSFINISGDIFMIVFCSLLIFLLIIFVLIFIRVENKSFRHFLDVFNRNIERMFISPRLIFLAPLFIMLLLVIVTTNYRNTRYLSIALPFILFISSIAIYKIIRKIKNIKLAYILPTSLSLILIINSFIYLTPKYKFRMDNLSKYKEYPAIVLTPNSSAINLSDTYAQEIESLMDVLPSFPAEIHSRAQFYGTNVLGITSSVIEKKYKLALSKNDKKYLNSNNKLLDYKKEVGRKFPNGVLLFIEFFVSSPKKQLIKMTKDKLGFKKVKYIEKYVSPYDNVNSTIGSENHSFVFDVYLISK